MSTTVTSPVQPSAAAASPGATVMTGSFLDDLDMRIVEAGPATQARKCSTDNGCDTQKTGDC